MRAKVGDIELYYELTGDGPVTVTMTHGIGASADDWAPVVPALAQKYRVLTWDVRGHARSDRPATGYGIAQFAADWAGLLDALGIDKAIVCGHSMGGTITQRFILDHPHKAIAAIILSTSSEVNERGRQRWAGQAEEVERLGMAEYLRRTRPPEQTEEYLGDHPDVLEAEEKRARNNPDGAVYGQIARAVSDYNYTKALESVRMPALVVVGNDDISTPPGGSVIISRRIPGAELHILPGLGHGLMREDPVQLVGLMTQFIDRVLAQQGVAADD